MRRHYLKFQNILQEKLVMKTSLDVTSQLRISLDVTSQLRISIDVTSQLRIFLDVTSQLRISLDVTSQLRISLDVTSHLLISPRISACCLNLRFNSVPATLVPLLISHLSMDNVPMCYAVATPVTRTGLQQQL